MCRFKKAIFSEWIDINIRKNKNQDKLENDTKCTKYHNISYAQNNEMHKNVRFLLTKI